MELAGRRVTLMGLGTHGGGVAAACYLAERCGELTVTDAAPAAQLADSIAQVAGRYAVRWRLGGHDASDFRDRDLVVVNPAVALGHPLVELARRDGAEITSEIELLLSACPARVVGITGSLGKSTTTQLAADMLAASGERVWVGGNIGRSLLPQLDQMRRRDWAVLELSSFQLAWLSGEQPWLEAAAITGFSPNHLDWHGSLEAYAAAKRRILRLVRHEGVCVLNGQDEVVRTWADDAPDDVLLVDDPRAALAACRVEIRYDPALSPAQAAPRKARSSRGRKRAALPRRCQWTAPGEHVALDAALAATLVRALGGSAQGVRAALAAFRGLEHRLEYIGQVAGRHCFNDSKATTPHATVAALQALAGRRVWLLAGGANKGLDFAPLVEACHDTACGVACFGQSGPLLGAQLEAAGYAGEVRICGRLDDAFAWAATQSRPGDVLLCSPACASFDQYRDYAERGRALIELVARHALLHAPPTP